MSKTFARLCGVNLSIVQCYDNVGSFGECPFLLIDKYFVPRWLILNFWVEISVLKDDPLAKLLDSRLSVLSRASNCGVFEREVTKVYSKDTKVVEVFKLLKKGFDAIRAQTIQNDFDHSATTLKIVTATYASILINSNKIFDPLRIEASTIAEELSAQSSVIRPKDTTEWL